jgi:hypothetical protein
MSLSIDASTDGASLTASATVTPYANFPAGLKLYIAVTEDFYEDSGTNGETEFHFVQRKLLPNGSGNTLTALTDGTPVTVTKSANFTFGNVAQGNYNLWSSDFSNITVVAWVQDPSSRFIFQAAIDADRRERPLSAPCDREIAFGPSRTFQQSASQRRLGFPSRPGRCCMRRPGSGQVRIEKAGRKIFSAAGRPGALSA